MHNILYYIIYIYILGLYQVIKVYRLKIRGNSESGGRLNIYRNIKSDLATWSYVANERSVGVRRVLAGLRAGCLPLDIETGRYTGIPHYQRTCRLCDFGEVEY